MEPLLATEKNLINEIIVGECSQVMDNMSPNIIDLVITSPPYDNLRNYKTYTFNYKKIIKSLYRIMKFGGVIVWIVGDATINGSETGTSFRQALYFIKTGFFLHDTMIYEKNTSSFPARRNGNRYTQIFEYMFIFSKGKPKTVNLICDKKNKWEGWINWGKNTDRQKDGSLIEKEDIKPVPEFSPRNNIWKFNVGNKYGQSDILAYKHPATFPEKLAEDHILTWSNEEDIILDPMCGAGTTCIMAKKLNRKYIGIDISSEYCELTKLRILKE